VNPLPHKRTPLLASLAFTALASSGTTVVWNGLPFIAKLEYGFSEGENLCLYLMIAFVYVIGALTSGLAARKIQPYFSSRVLLAILLVIEMLVCSMPLFFASQWVVWAAGGVAGFCSAWIWPIVESYLVAGRHGHAMRRAIGWWNITWMVSVACVMFAMAPMMEEYASMVIVGLGAINVLAIGVLPWFGATPSHHDQASSVASVPDGYRSLLRGARVLLPLSYMINGVLAPLLPFILFELHVKIIWQTPLAAVWMVSRVLVTAVMWHWASWQGKWSVLWIAVGTLSVGFVSILSANGLFLLFVGLTIFGVGMGVTYYAALYYAMAVGRAEVNAGGTHEAFIGGGYAMGPLIGLATFQVSNQGSTTSYQSLVIVVLILIALALLGLGFYWRKAR